MVMNSYCIVTCMFAEDLPTAIVRAAIWQNNTAWDDWEVLCEVELSSSLHVFLSVIHSLLMRDNMLQETAGLVRGLCMR